MLSSYAFVGIRRDDLPKVLAKMPVDDIILCVCAFYGLTVKEIKSKCRKRVIVRARFMAAYFLRKYTKLTLNEISECFGVAMADHTSVMHAVKSIENQLSLKSNNDTKDDVESIKQTFLLTISNETINSKQTTT